MLYKYLDKHIIKTVNSPIRGQKFYSRADLEAIRGSNDALYERGASIGIKNETKFSRATIEDMEGVYAVALELFGKTTSAEARKPLIAKCPDGNYVVKEADEIQAFIHIQPLRHEALEKFMHGKIFGRDITADDLDCFEPGKTVDVLIKSMGATRQYGESKHRFYIQRLLFGVASALAELGKQGIIIRKICATSETETGIALSLHARMRTVRRLKPPRENKPARYAFELDVATSDLPLLREYKQALAEWQQLHSTQD